MLKKQLSIYFLIILLGGLFWSRALLSITVLVWAIISFIQLFQTDRSFFKSTAFRWSLIPIFLWILGAWQEPWGNLNTDYLLTLSAYPATLLIVQATPKDLIENKWIKIWLVATVVGLSYPIYWYFKNFTDVNQAYGSGQSLPTFMDTDHVRFSIFLCSSFLIILCTDIFQKKQKIFFASSLFVAILFISVRTGWVLAISILFLYALLHLLFTNKKNKKPIFIGTVAVLILLLITYAIFPTIQQKLAYSIWEWQQFQPGNYQSNLSDGTRRAINYTAWETIKSNYSLNTGWQGIPTVLQNSFSKYFNVKLTEFGWPFNQWLYWWMGSGWWGMLLFSGWLFYPAINAIKQKQIGIFCWTIAIVLSCLVETTLNYQYGVLLHIFPLAMLWKITATSTVDNS